MLCRFENSCKKFKLHECPFLTGEPVEKCLKLFIINKIQDEALLTDKQKVPITLRIDSNGTDREAFKRLKEIELNIENNVLSGFNLYIYSKKVGNGKTSWAIKLLNAYIDKIWYKSGGECRCLFINVPNFLISMKENFSQRVSTIEHIKNNILSADLVVWDDVATKGCTVFETETLLNYINGRINMGKANIYTSNVVGEELRECVGDRLYSRIENSSEVITFNGSDKRGLIIK